MFPRVGLNCGEATELRREKKEAPTGTNLQCVRFSFANGAYETKVQINSIEIRNEAR